MQSYTFDTCSVGPPHHPESLPTRRASRNWTHVQPISFALLVELRHGIVFPRQRRVNRPVQHMQRQQRIRQVQCSQSHVRQALHHDHGLHHDGNDEQAGLEKHIVIYQWVHAERKATTIAYP